MVKKIALFTFLLLFVVIASMINYINILDEKNISLSEKNTKLTNILNNKNERIKDLSKKVDEFKLISYRDNIVRKKYPAFAKIIEVVYNKSKKYGFDPNLIISLIHTESSFRPNVVSSHGAYGLMQVNYSVWKDELQLKPSKIFDIEYNIEMGLRILKRYYDKSNGDIMKALHLYNNGYKYNNVSYNKKVTSTVYY